MLQKETAKFIYVADPMCSWCYAFGPELKRVLEEFDLPLKIVAGGLFVGERTLPLDDDLRAYLRETWTRVNKLSGRHVSFDLLSWNTWTYDTEPSCRALVAVRDDGPAEAFDFFARMQAAFYADNQDTVKVEVLSELAGRHLHLDDPVLVNKTAADFATAKKLGAHGFPTLFLDTGVEKITVAAGYVRAEQVLRSIALFLS